MYQLPYFQSLGKKQDSTLAYQWVSSERGQYSPHLYEVAWTHQVEGLLQIILQMTVAWEDTRQPPCFQTNSNKAHLYFIQYFVISQQQDLLKTTVNLLLVHIPISVCSLHCTIHPFIHYIINISILGGWVERQMVDD